MSDPDIDNKPDPHQVREAFKNNPSVVVGEDGSIFYCPSAPYKRDGRCPVQIDEANPAKDSTESDPRFVKQKSPSTNDLQRVYKDDNVKVRSDGTVVYCRDL